MTDLDLTRPECSIFTRNESYTITNDGNGFLTEVGFFRKFNAPLLDVILCVAGMNKDDTRRVVITFVPEVKIMAINFPSSNVKLNAVERRLMERLR